MTQLARLLTAAWLAMHAGFAAADCDSLASMAWLLGEWRADGSTSTWLESWTPAGPRTWEGTGVETSKADPAKPGTEELRLVEMGGAVFYVAMVSHNERPVAFRLVECGDGKLTFTNPGHDFPRRLDYALQPDGRLHVRVSDGGEKGFMLDFARAPQGAEAENAVLAAEDSRFAAMVSGDPEAMLRWLAEDLAYAHSTGAIETRDGLIESIRSGALRYAAIEPSERRVVFSGPDAAHVLGLARIEARAGPTAVDFVARYLAVYGRSGGEWRLRAWQSSRVP